MRTCSLITAEEKLSEGLARSTFPATCRRDWPRGTNDCYVRLGLPPDERGWHGEGLIGYRSANRRSLGLGRLAAAKSKTKILRLGFPALVSTRGNPPSPSTSLRARLLRSPR